MSRTWKLTDLEFFVLWERRREEILPAPFTFLSRTPYYEDFLREKSETEQRLHGCADRWFDEVLDIVAAPDLHIVVRGIDGEKPDNPLASIRLLAVRRGEQGYLLEQLPGETIEHSGGFVVAECDVLQLAAALVTRLPDTDPGRRPHIPLPAPPDHGDDMDDSCDRSVLKGAFGDGDLHDGIRFLDAVPKNRGLIVVRQGISRFGPRGRVTRQLEWRDLSDDGRYLLTMDRPPAALAADAKRLIAAINTEIAIVVRAIKDERN